jgi:hypothetical protein
MNAKERYDQLRQEYDAMYSELYEQHKAKRGYDNEDCQSFAMWIGGETMRAMQKKHPSIGYACWDRINEVSGFGFTTVSKDEALAAITD